MRLIVCDRVRKHMSRPRRRFKSPRSPTAIEVEAFDRCLADNRASIRCDVNNATPLAIHPHAGEHREQFNNGCGGVFDRMRTSALGVAQITVDTSPDDQLTLVGLTNVA